MFSNDDSFYYSNVPPCDNNFNPQLEDATALFDRLGLTYVKDIVVPAGGSDCTDYNLPYQEYEFAMKNRGMTPTRAHFDSMNERYKDSHASLFIDGNKLALCFINDKVGHGVFAMEDIPEKTPIATYAGELQSTEAFGFSNKEEVEYLTYVGGVWYINSKQRGNIARFIQELPDKRTLEQCKLSHFPGIARQNVERYIDERTYRIGSEEITVYIPKLASCCFIKKGEQLGYQYVSSELAHSVSSIRIKNIFSSEHVFFGARGRVLGTLEELQTNVYYRDAFVNFHGLGQKHITSYLPIVTAMETPFDSKW